MLLPTVAIRQLLLQFFDVFSVPPALPPQRICDHQIVLKDGTLSIKQWPYQYPLAQKDFIEQMTMELLDSGVVQHIKSPFASLIVLVKNKASSWIMCIDYCKLNEATVKNRFPISLIEELLDELGGATILSKLDLRSWYNQVRMHTFDIHKTVFRTDQRHFEFLVMSFGLTNAPAIFQALMNDTFWPLLRRSVFIFRWHFGV